MDAVKQILAAEDTTADDMKLGESYEISGEYADMDLTIEKVGKQRLSVAHYYEQRGDLMRDPEIVFDISGDTWRPIEYRQDPGIYRRNEAGLPDVAEFAHVWSQTLENQGFTPNGGENQ